MDIVERLHEFDENEGYNIGGIAAAEIERLRQQVSDLQRENAAYKKLWSVSNEFDQMNSEEWSKECERLRQQNAELRENNKLLYNLFHEAVALPQGVCPRPATAGDGMFNPQHRALNKPTGGK